MKFKTGPPPHTLNIIREKKTLSPSSQGHVLSWTAPQKQSAVGGGEHSPLKFHLGTLSTTFFIPRLGQLTCQPAHCRAERASISAGFTSGQPPPTLHTLSVATEGFSALYCGRGLSESTSLTHRISDEILQGASLDKLSYQIEPLVLVQHTDEPQHVGMIEAPHDFDLKIRQKQR